MSELVVQIVNVLKYELLVKQYETNFENETKKKEQEEKDLIRQVAKYD